jgi:5-formyltetrahydrofolate cyclo-ligase
MDQSSKTALRTHARRLLAALSPDARAAASAAICRRVAALPAWGGARTVAFYAAQASEPDLAGLFAIPGKVACFPRVSGELLEFHRCAPRDLLAAGRWNLLEPHPDCPIVPPAKIDLFLIPGLAFTRTGGRLGRGGGYYDRFLTRIHPAATKVGICFHAQLVPALPIEAHDHEVDAVITEEFSIVISRPS